MANPQTLNLNPEQQHKIASALKDLQTCELVEKAQLEALTEAQEKIDHDSSWFANPSLVISAFVISFGAGIILAPMLSHH